jgi:hypothetical protein
MRSRPVDRVEGVQELGERAARPGGAPVGVDVLPEQRDLADAVGDEPAHLGHQLGERPRHLPAPGGGHDAVGADLVAAGGDLHPGLELPRAALGQMAREALELEEALRRERVAREELRELVDLPGAEGDVDERELGEDLVLDRLRPAAPDADDPLRIGALEVLGVVQVGDEALVGLLADRAGVEEDELRLLALGDLLVAERLEHALHALGVVLVHLAPEGGDVEGLHPGSKGRLALPA